ncbi:MAG: phosphonopyruvate decarboxylase [Spirochaetes bacterium]|nr:phosphonopyruvate decarboxylase [Spirochaetota bacterium]
MIQAESFVRAAQEKGFSLWTGVPCSYLKPFINYVIDAAEQDGQLRYIPAVNEGDAVAIAAGSTLAGVPAIVMFQNSGLGNAVNPLSSLTYIFKIPVLIITTLRGEPGGPHDEPQHELMGSITTEMLDLLRIRWEYFPTEEGNVKGAMDRAVQHMQETGLPFAFVMRKDSVAPYKLKSVKTGAISITPDSKESSMGSQARYPSFHREPFLKVVQKIAGTTLPVIATTGYTGRELYALDDRPNQFYMVGSMGCASSFALGIAQAYPTRPVIVLDGDGAVLMRMGALSVIGTEKPRNLIHIVLDNGTYESTGNQATVSPAVDLCAVAAACGYEQVVEIQDPEELEGVLVQLTTRAKTITPISAPLKASKGQSMALTFIRIPIKAGAPENLPRPTVTPPEVAVRFAKFLREHVGRMD